MEHEITRMVEGDWSEGAAADALAGLPKRRFVALLLECGIIPERFGHDSSAEKRHTKLTELCLAEALTRIGIDSHAVTERSGRADVESDALGASGIVGDTKALRLSRSTINPKDQKLDDMLRWRNGREHAMLVAPLRLYPRNGRIWTTASELGVVLLDYYHIAFLVQAGARNPSRLWGIRGGDRDAYLASADAAVEEAAGGGVLAAMRRRGAKAIERLKCSETSYLRNRISTVRRKSKPELLDMALDGTKLLGRIARVRAIDLSPSEGAAVNRYPRPRRP